MVAYDALGGGSTLAYAVWNSHALVGGARDVEAGLRFEQAREADEARGMADDGLRVRAVVAEDAREARLAERAHEALELGARERR